MYGVLLHESLMLVNSLATLQNNTKIFHNQYEFSNMKFHLPCHDLKPYTIAPNRFCTRYQATDNDSMPLK